MRYCVAGRPVSENDRIAIILRKIRQLSNFCDQYTSFKHYPCSTLRGSGRVKPQVGGDNLRKARLTFLLGSAFAISSTG